MKTQDLLIVLITFVVGVLSGGYLYVVGFAPQFDSGIGVTEETYEDLAIVGEIYGGMRFGTPPSFQVLEDGTFRYILFNESADTVAQAREGTLPRVLMREVRTVLSDSALEQASQIVEPEMCASYVDGNEYRYRITKDSVVYTLDTCGTDFALEDDLALTLDKLWNYFATLE